MQRIKDFLSRSILHQWQILEDEHAARPRPSGQETAAVLGLYVLAMLVLIATEYAPRPFYNEFIRDSVPRDLRRFVRALSWSWFLSFVYIVPPALYARKFLGLRLPQLGLRTEGFIQHAWIYIGLFMLVFPFVVGVSATEVFQDKYPLFGKRTGADEDLLLFLIWELSYAVQFVGLEFFFRGVLLFGAVRVIGPWAITVMVVPYMMIHFGKPAAEAIGAILAGAALGLIALRTGSIYAGMCIHIAVAWSMDRLSLWRKGKLFALFGLE